MKKFIVIAAAIWAVGMVLLIWIPEEPDNRVLVRVLLTITLATIGGAALLAYFGFRRWAREQATRSRSQLQRLATLQATIEELEVGNAVEGSGKDLGVRGRPWRTGVWPL